MSCLQRLKEIGKLDTFKIVFKQSVNELINTLTLVDEELTYKILVENGIDPQEPIRALKDLNIKGLKCQLESELDGSSSIKIKIKITMIYFILLSLLLLLFPLKINTLSRYL